MATKPAGIISDVDSAVDSMFDPKLVEQSEADDDREVEDEATEEDADDQHSEETEDEETEDDESEESDESEDEGETEDDEEGSEEESGDLYTVTVDGEKKQVTLDELTRGYSGQQYVQMGMKQAAEAKKQAESVYQQLQHERQQIAQAAELLNSGQLAAPPKEPDKALFESDPIGYMEAKIKYDEDAAAYQQQMEQLRHHMARHSEAEQRSMEAYMQDQVTQLRAVEPEFNDPEKAQQARSVMTKVGEEVYGYSPEEIGAITDHRAIRVLRDAARWQELQANKGKTRAKVTKNVAKRGKRKATKATTGESRRRRQRDRLKKTGSIDDALGLMLDS